MHSFRSALVRATLLLLLAASPLVRAQDVWDLTANVETRTVDTHVMRLREKLGKARRYLETVRGIGYRLAGGS